VWGKGGLGEVRREKGRSAMEAEYKWVCGWQRERRKPFV